jgi:hypothetical protein
MQMTREDAKALLAHVANAVLETVRETPQGAPEGPMYLAFQHYGMSLDTFQQITAALIETGKVRRSGNVLYPVTK